MHLGAGLLFQQKTIFPHLVQFAVNIQRKQPQRIVNRISKKSRHGIFEIVKKRLKLRLCRVMMNATRNAC